MHTLDGMRQVKGVYSVRSNNYAHISPFVLPRCYQFHPYPLCYIHWYLSLTIVPVPMEQSRRIWVNRPHESIVIQSHQNDVGQNSVHIVCDHLYDAGIAIPKRTTYKYFTEIFIQMRGIFLSYLFINLWFMGLHLLPFIFIKYWWQPLEIKTSLVGVMWINSEYWFIC